MKRSDIPTRFNIPFADAAGGSYVRDVPEASQIGIQDGAASLTDGFPPLNFLPVGAGGVPPFGQDMNGILKQATDWSRWTGAGSPVPYDSAFATAIGGYPKGALLSALNFDGFWLCTADDNTSDPDAAPVGLAVGWIAFFPYPQETLDADRDYYVSTSGSDSNSGLNVADAWATLQHAWDYVSAYINLAGHSVTIHVSDGTYNTGMMAQGALTGAEGPTSFNILGNAGTPANVKVTTSGDCFSGINGSQFHVEGVELSSTAGSCLVAGRGSFIQWEGVRFNTASGNHVSASSTGIALAVDSYTIIGGAQRHFNSNTFGFIGASGSPTATVTGTPAFSSEFAFASISSLIDAHVMTFSGAATGKRYTATLLSNIYTNGGGASFFPGSVAGSVATSGIYN